MLLRLGACRVGIASAPGSAAALKRGCQCPRGTTCPARGSARRPAGRAWRGGRCIWRGGSGRLMGGCEG